MDQIMEAINKINTEMQKNPSDKYLEAIGHHVIDACTCDANAAAVLDDKKTLAGAMAEVKEEAMAAAKNDVAVMEDIEVYAIVDKYFGISDAPEAPTPKAKPAGIVVDFDKFF